MAAVTREKVFRRQTTFVQYHTSAPLAKNRLLVWVVGFHLLSLENMNLFFESLFGLNYFLRVSLQLMIGINQKTIIFSEWDMFAKLGC